MRRALVVAIAASLVACAPLRAIVAPAGDYGDYRRFRVAEGLGEKLAAAWTYLRDHPEGTFHDEVAIWFWPAEQGFHAEAGRTPGGASAYLAFLPDGPHAEQARTFLRAHEIALREAPLRTQRALEEARRRAEKARRALGEAVETWARRAAKVDVFREPRAALEASPFGKAYWHTGPTPVCDDEGCSKYLTFTYRVPEATTILDRTVVLEVRVDTVADVTTGISLVLPKRGFLWWLEGSEGREVDPADASARAESIARARNRVETVVRDAIGKECTTTEGEVARILACGELRIAIGTTPNGDDVVRFVTLPPP